MVASMFDCAAAGVWVRSRTSEMTMLYTKALVLELLYNMPIFVEIEYGFDCNIKFAFKN